MSKETGKSFCLGCFTPVGFCVAYAKEEDAEDFLTVCLSHRAKNLVGSVSDQITQKDNNLADDAIER